jgi:hypothetical protein
MPKKSQPKRNTLESNTVEHFQAFLAAADTLALQFLVREGIVGDLDSDRNEYELNRTRPTCSGSQSAWGCTARISA